MKRKIVFALLYILTAVLLAIFVHSIIRGEYDYIIESFLSLALCIITIYRMKYNKPTSKIQYEKAYMKILEGAFYDKKLRNELFKGLLYFNQNKLEKALDKFEQLLRKCRRSNDVAVVHYFIACSYLDLGDELNAIKNFKESIKYNPKFYKAHTYLASVYKNKGDNTQAIELLTKAIEIDPQAADAFLLLASVKYNLMEYDEAIVYANRANDLRASLYDATQILALSYAALGDTKNAEKYYKMSITYGCKNPQGLRATIDAMYTTGKTTASIREYYEYIFEKTKKNAINIELAKGEVNRLSSKIGGNPHLPKNFIWPVNNGQPLNFLMQINLSDVKGYDMENLLPEKGMLYFFYDYANQPWNPEEGTSLVYYCEGDDISEVKCPSGVEIFREFPLSFNNYSDIPSYDELSLSYSDINYEMYAQAAANKSYIIEDTERSKLLGYADIIQNEIVSGPNEILLVQICSENDIMFGDAGNLYFYINKEELANRKFNKVKAYLQCY